MSAYGEAARQSAAPREMAGHQAAQAAAAQVLADCHAGLHEQEIMAAHQGTPSIGEQDRTHGAGLPAVDLGKPLPRT